MKGVIRNTAVHGDAVVPIGQIDRDALYRRLRKIADRHRIVTSGRVDVQLFGVRQGDCFGSKGDADTGARGRQGDGIGTCRAAVTENVDATSRINHITPVAGSPDDCIAVRSAADLIGTGAAGQSIAAGTTEQDVVPVASRQSVISGAAIEQISGIAARQCVGTVTAQERQRGRRDRRAIHGVVATSRLDRCRNRQSRQCHGVVTGIGGDENLFHIATRDTRGSRIKPRRDEVGAGLRK